LRLSKAERKRASKTVHDARLLPLGIKVIVVGAGFGGLCAAIECDRKGHPVIQLEKAPELK
jgi:monoamine oxidase